MFCRAIIVCVSLLLTGCVNPATVIPLADGSFEVRATSEHQDTSIKYAVIGAEKHCNPLPYVVLNKNTFYQGAIHEDAQRALHGISKVWPLAEAANSRGSRISYHDNPLASDEDYVSTFIIRCGHQATASHHGYHQQAPAPRHYPHPYTPRRHPHHF